MSVTLFGKPRAEREPSPQRQALAEAIRGVDAARAAIATTEQTRSEATEHIYAAHGVIERADEAAARVEEDALAFVRARAKGEAKPTPAMRRGGPTPAQRKAAAERDIEAWERVRDATHIVAEEQRSDLANAERGVEGAVAAVIVAEAQVLLDPLVTRLEQLNAEATVIRAALHELTRKGQFSGDRKARAMGAMGAFGSPTNWCLADYAPPGYERDPVRGLMEAAFARLKADPSASLPTLDEIRGAARG